MEWGRQGMHLSTDEARALRQAMIELGMDNPRKFDDALWLGLGDRCGPVLERLIESGCVVASSRRIVTDFAITDLGRELIDQLEPLCRPMPARPTVKPACAA